MHLLFVDQLNTYDVLVSDDVVFTRAAYDALVTKQVTKQAAKQQPRGTATPTDETEPEQEDESMTTMSLHKEARDVLIAPVVSEKSYGLLDQNKYTFLVRKDANKTEIKIAVEQVFSVRVTAVNTVNRVGKRRRTRAGWGRATRHQAGDRERRRGPAHRHLLRPGRLSRRDERY